MHEPIRILGFSAYRFIEGLVDESIYTRIGYDADVSSNWYHLSDYARQNFREFLQDILDDYLDINIPVVLGTGRYQARFDINVYLPNGYQFQPDRVWLANNDEPTTDVQFDTMSISVDSRQFRPFRVELPVPHDNIFHNPRDMWAYIGHVGRILLDHVRQNDRNYGSPSIVEWIREMDATARAGGGGYLVPPEYAERIWQSVFREETEEQKQAREKRAEEKRLASQKARELLLDHCNTQQRADYKKNEWFIVKGKKNVYRIRKASQINVDVLDKKGDVKYRLCTVPDKNHSGLPIEDQLLAQKTLIELNEQQFLDIAIRWEVHSPRTEWSWVGV